MEFKSRIFRPLNEDEFNSVALDIFHFQYESNEIYRRYTNALNVQPVKIMHYQEIPFLPVSFFKTHPVISGVTHFEKQFESSGTMGDRSHHKILDLAVYDESLIRGFEQFYGSLENYTVFALTPTPAQNPDSSLIYMISKWILNSGSADSGFYYDRPEMLAELLVKNEATGKQSLLIGLTYALIDFAERFPLFIPRTIIMETGGMKGKRKEMIREELHNVLSQRFGCKYIHSEYGMTEMLSQAYAMKMGLFKTPSWMKVLIRDMNDPLCLLPDGKSGGINIIDLANYNSCSFLELQDLGRIDHNGYFEVLGRFDFSDLRGCNLMIG